MAQITSTELGANGRLVNFGDPASNRDVVVETILVYCRPVAVGSLSVLWTKKGTPARPQWRRLQIDISSAALSYGLFSQGDSAKQLPQSGSNAGAVVYDQWQHFAATWSGGLLASGINLYIGASGAPISLVAGNGYGDLGVGDSVGPDTGGEMVAWNRGDGTRGFVGDGAYVARWNRVLTLTELRQAQSDGPLSVPSGLVFLYANGADLSGYSSPVVSRTTYVAGALPPNTNLGGAAASVVFVGTIPAQTAVQGATLTLDITPYFSGDLRAFAYSLQAGSGVTVNASTGIATFNTATIATYSGIIFKATDTSSNVASSNAFTFTVTTPGAGTKLQWRAADESGTVPSLLTNAHTGDGQLLSDWTVVANAGGTGGKALNFNKASATGWWRLTIPGANTTGRVDTRGRFYSSASSNGLHVVTAKVGGTNAAGSTSFYQRFDARAAQICRRSTGAGNWIVIVSSATLPATGFVGWWKYRYTYTPGGSPVHRFALWDDDGTGSDAAPDVTITSNDDYSGVNGQAVGFGANASTDDLMDWITVGINGADADVTPSDAAVPVAFSGVVPSQFPAASGAFSLDLAAYFNGNRRPFTYAKAAGTLPPGVSLNASTGLLTGPATTEGTYSGLAFTATDTGAATATTNTFSITVDPSGPALTVVAAMDGGNADANKTVITRATSSAPTVTLGYRDAAQTDGGWRHFLFGIDNAAGKTPTIRWPKAGHRFGWSGFNSAWKPVYSTDFVTWTQLTRTFTTDYIEWTFPSAMPAGIVYFASHPTGRQADAAAMAASMLASYPGVASPSPSANSQGVYATSPAWSDERGIPSGGFPQHAIKLAWGGATTDGYPKRKLVVMAGIHAAGEQQSWRGFTAAVAWMLDSPEANALRANWDVYLYFLVNPNGVFSGNTRLTGRSSTDPNRDWYSSGVLAEITNIRAAILSDTGGTVDALFSFHGVNNVTDLLNILLLDNDANVATRRPIIQSWLDAISVLYGSNPPISPTGEASPPINPVADYTWGYTVLKANVSFPCEFGGQGENSQAAIESVGRAWVKTLQSVDAEGKFTDGPVVNVAAGVGRGVGAGLQAQVSASVTIAASTGRGAGVGLQAQVSVGTTIAMTTGKGAGAGLTAAIGAGNTIFAAVGRGVGAGLQAGISIGTSLFMATGNGVGAGLKIGIADATIEAKVGRGVGAGLQAGVESAIEIVTTTGSGVGAGLSFVLNASAAISFGTGRGIGRGNNATIWTGSDDRGPTLVLPIPDPGPGFILPGIDQDHASIAWANFLAQYGDSPRLEAVARSLYAPIGVLSAALRDLVDERGLDTAKGVQLDGIGQIVGQTREVPDLVYIKFFGFAGQPNIGTFDEARIRNARESSTVEGSTTLLDAEYRKLLYWKIGLNNGHGTGPEIAASIRAIFDATQVRIEDRGNARLGIWFNSTPQTNAAFAADPIRWIPVAAGVGIEMLSGAETQIFGFINQGLRGFGVGSFIRSDRI